jgi:hypothetical protein
MIVKQRNKIVKLLKDVKPGIVFEYQNNFFIRIKSTYMEIEEYMYFVTAIDITDGNLEDIPENHQVRTYPNAIYILDKEEENK